MWNKSSHWLIKLSICYATEAFRPIISGSHSPPPERWLNIQLVSCSFSNVKQRTPCVTGIFHILPPSLPFGGQWSTVFPLPPLPSYVLKHRRQPLHTSTLCQQPPLWGHHHVTKRSRSCEPICAQSSWQKHRGSCVCSHKTGMACEKPGFNKTSGGDGPCIHFALFVNWRRDGI